MVCWKTVIGSRHRVVVFESCPPDQVDVVPEEPNVEGEEALANTASIQGRAFWRIRRGHMQAVRASPRSVRSLRVASRWLPQAELPYRWTESAGALQAG